MTLCDDMLADAKRGARRYPAVAADVRRFLTSRETPTGSYPGRDLRGDLYYTHFGLLALAAVSPESLAPGAHCTDFLTGREASSLDLIHACCLARCYYLLGQPAEASLLSRIRDHRREGGGFCPTPGAADTLYATFLACGAVEDLGAHLDKEGVAALQASVAARQGPAGSFVNAESFPMPTTPTTAAAVVLQRRLGQTPAAETLDWLVARWQDDGGFAPVAGGRSDLLSAAVAAHALRLAGQPLSHEKAETLARFVLSLQADTGGFRGSDTDVIDDPEYTFYALLALGAGGDDDI